DDAARVADHEGDRFGRHALGGHDQIALVLAILIVHDDDHPTGAQLGENLADGIERRRLGCGCALTGQWQDLGHGARSGDTAQSVYPSARRRTARTNSRPARAPPAAATTATRSSHTQHAPKVTRRPLSQPPSSRPTSRALRCSADGGPFTGFDDRALPFLPDGSALAATVGSPQSQLAKEVDDDRDHGIRRSGSVTICLVAD